MPFSKLSFGLLLALSVSTTSFAKPKVNPNRITVRQVDIGSQRVSVNVPGHLPIVKGQNLIASSRGINCFLKVKAIKRRVAIASTRGCQIAKDLRRGQILEASDFSYVNGVRVANKRRPIKKKTRVRIRRPSPKVDPVANAVERQSAPEVVVKGLVRAPRNPEPEVALAKGIIISTFVAGSNEFTNITVPDNNYVGVEGTLETTVSGGVGAKYSFTRNNAIGFNAGFAYEFPRTVKDTLIHAENDSYIGTRWTEENPTFSYGLFEANLTYGFLERFYGYAGVNYTLPVDHRFDGVEMIGAVGGQIGAAMKMGQWFVLEAGYRLTQLELKFDEADFANPGMSHSFMLTGSFLLSL